MQTEQEKLSQTLFTVSERQQVHDNEQVQIPVPQVAEQQNQANEQAFKAQLCAHLKNQYPLWSLVLLQNLITSKQRANPQAANQESSVETALYKKLAEELGRIPAPKKPLNAPENKTARPLTALEKERLKRILQQSQYFREQLTTRLPYSADECANLQVRLSKYNHMKKKYNMQKPAFLRAIGLEQTIDAAHFPNVKLPLKDRQIPAGNEQGILEIADSKAFQEVYQRLTNAQRQEVFELDQTKIQTKASDDGELVAIPKNKISTYFRILDENQIREWQIRNAENSDAQEFDESQLGKYALSAEQSRKILQSQTAQTLSKYLQADEFDPLSGIVYINSRNAEIILNRLLAQPIYYVKAEKFFNLDMKFQQQIFGYDQNSKGPFLLHRDSVNGLLELAGVLPPSPINELTFNEASKIYYACTDKTAELAKEAVGNFEKFLLLSMGLASVFLIGSTLATIIATAAIALTTAILITVIILLAKKYSRDHKDRKQQRKLIKQIITSKNLDKELKLLEHKKPEDLYEWLREIIFKEELTLSSSLIAQTANPNGNVTKLIRILMDSKQTLLQEASKSASFNSHDILAQLLSQIRTVPPENQFKTPIEPPNPWSFYGGLLFDAGVLATTGYGLAHVVATVLAVATSPYVLPVSLAFAAVLGLVVFAAQYVASKKRQRIKSTAQKNYEKLAYKEAQVSALLYNFNLLSQAYAKDIITGQSKSPLESLQGLFASPKNSFQSELATRGSRTRRFQRSLKKGGSDVPPELISDDTLTNFANLDMRSLLSQTSGRSTPEKVISEVLGGSDSESMEKAPKLATGFKQGLKPKLLEQQNKADNNSSDKLVSSLLSDNMSGVLTRKAEQEIDTARKSSKKGRGRNRIFSRMSARRSDKPKKGAAWTPKSLRK